jgi:hypothetical protein
MICVDFIASCPGHSHIFNVTCSVTLKTWEWPGDEAMDFIENAFFSSIGMTIIYSWLLLSSLAQPDFYRVMGGEGRETVW